LLPLAPVLVAFVLTLLGSVPFLSPSCLFRAPPRPRQLARLFFARRSGIDSVTKDIEYVVDSVHVGVPIGTHLDDLS
jgi:hypothetical protein